MNHVRGGNKKDLREVVFYVQIMIDKHEILFGIENFEQRGRRVAAEIHGHFVDFVQHEDGILCSRFLHHLDDLPRQSANVSPPMAANFGLVANSAERHAYKLAARGFGNRHS